MKNGAYCLPQSILENAIERMPGGFLIYRADEEETILYANQTTATLFGCETIDEFLEYVHSTFKGMIFHEDLDAVQKSIQEQILSNEEKLDNVTYRIRRKDGQIRWIEDYGHFVRTAEEGDIFYVFIFDITERKLSEDEVRRTEEALRSEKALNQAKNNFIFNLSHDIRTPMNAILGYITLAMRHKTSPDVVSNHLEKASIAGNHLLTLIDELLELAEVDASKIRITPVPQNLEEVVCDAITIIAPEFDKKNIDVIFSHEDADDDVFVDAAHLTRAIVHILSNAAKFTPQNGKVTVTITKKAVSETGFGRFEIAIADTGIGMSKEFIDKAFEAFEREATSTQSGLLGTGIGLTITKRILQMMGGSISITSTLDVGSTFTLSIPLKLCNREPKKETQTPLLTKHGKGRILVVEDIELNRMLAETVLSESGFEVECVPDGCDAVDTVTSKPAGYYIAILMDIQMPIMNGYEATRAIRASGRKDLQTLPIIALSANARPEDKNKSFESGMNAHVAKPFDVEGLISTLYKYMDAKS